MTRRPSGTATASMAAALAALALAGFVRWAGQGPSERRATYVGPDGRVLAQTRWTGTRLLGWRPRLDTRDRGFVQRWACQESYRFVGDDTATEYVGYACRPREVPR